MSGVVRLGCNDVKVKKDNLVRQIVYAARVYMLTEVFSE